jgi:S-adenosylhomocysteine hydrolase
MAKAEAAAAKAGVKVGAAVSSSPDGDKSTDPNQKAAAAGPPSSIIDVTWVKETLAEIRWSQTTFLSWLASQFKILDTKGKLEEVLPRLDVKQAEIVANELNKRQNEKLF